MPLRQFILNLATLPIKVGLLAGWFAILMTWERLLPASRKPETMTLSPSTRIGGNITLGLINAGLWAAVTLPLTAIAIGQATEKGFFDWRGTWATGFVGLAIDIVLLDFVAYFWHRASHEVDLLWRFHEVHHRDEFLDATTGVRFHFGEVIFGSAFRAIFICGSSTPLEHVIIFDVVMMVMNWFGHSNLRLPAWFEKTLSLLVVMPSYHWVHHKATQPESEQNYGVLFTIWDRMFGTRALRDRRLGMLLGVRHQSDLPLGHLLIMPFKERE